MTAADGTGGRDEAAFARAEDLPWPGSYTAVTVPAHRDFVSSIRALTRSSAALADLTLDDVEELQIAVDEAATLLLPLVDPAARWLRARFDIAPGHLLTSLSLDCRQGYSLDRSSLAWVMLTAVDPGVAIVEDGSHVTITIERGRGRAGLRDVTEPDAWPATGVDDIDTLFEQLVALPPDSPTRESLRERLIELNLPLVKHVARRYATWNLQFDDAVQIGSLGLIKAVDSFDPELGYRFGAYAVPKIMGEIRRYLRDSNWLIRVPRRTHELQGAVAQARDALTQELGRPPAISEIAERVGASAADVVDVVESFRIREGRSLDAADPHDAPNAELQAAVAFDERGFELSELMVDLREAMEGLTDVEREVIAKRFGSDMSQGEIAAEIGVSQMQVSRILRRTLDRMRRRMSD